MIWYAVFFCGISFFLISRRKQLKNAILIAHYEAVYWLIGGAATLDDIVYASKNKILDLPKRSHAIAIVTGGSRGIGLEVVKKFLMCDMHVIIGCRRVQAGLDAVEKLRNQGIISGKVDVIELDTSSLKSIKDFVCRVSLLTKQLHILINNAGIMFTPYILTEDEYESQWAVNYLGHAYLTHLLLPLMKETGDNSGYCSRIIHVSSCAHLAGSIKFNDINFQRTLYIPSEAYAQSKLAQIMFSNALDRRLKEEKAKVLSISVHPGVVDTQLFDGTFLKRVAPWAPKLLFKTPEQGSRSIVFAALSDTLENIGGIYMSNCQKARMSSYARNIEKQELLMKKTVEMLPLNEFCGVKK